MSTLSISSVNEIRKNYKAALQKRLCLGFLALIFTPVGMGLLALGSMNEMNSSTVSIRDGYLPSTMWVGKMGIALGSVRRWQSRYVLMPPNQEKERQDTLADLNAALTDVVTIGNHLDPTIRDDQGKLALLTQFQLIWPTYLAGVRQSLQYKDEGLNSLAIDMLRQQGRTNFQTMINFVRWDMNYNQNAGRAASDYSRHVSARVRRMLIAGTGISVGVCLVTTLYLLWHITSLIDMATGVGLRPKEGRTMPLPRRSDPACALPIAAC